MWVGLGSVNPFPFHLVGAVEVDLHVMCYLSSSISIIFSCLVNFFIIVVDICSVVCTYIYMQRLVSSSFLTTSPTRHHTSGMRHTSVKNKFKATGLGLMVMPCSWDHSCIFFLHSQFMEFNKIMMMLVNY